MRPAVSMALLLGLAGCADELAWDRLEPGRFSGRLRVEWVERDLFLFEPAPEAPLAFTRAGGERIEPGRMLTDGGSIPRPLWAFRSYSPWGYGPAFIVHDWLFEQRHCRIPPERSLEEAAAIMGEAIKTLVLAGGGPQPHEVLVVRSMLEAVRSPIARRLWESGACASPGAIDAELLRRGRKRRPQAPAEPPPEVTRFTIDFAAPCAATGADLVNPACPR